MYDWGSRTAHVSQIRCVVGTDTWLIEGEFVRNGRDTWWFTGTNVIRSCVIGGDGSGSAIPASPPAVSGIGPPYEGRIEAVYESADGNPGRPARQADLLTMPVARLCWLAFCSGTCLKRPGRQLFPPSDLWKELIDAKDGFTVKTKPFEDNLGLPRRVDLSTTNGQPVFQYHVTASTNLLERDFPLEFRAAQYRPLYARPRWSTDGWELQFTARGRVLRIGPGSEPGLAPKAAPDTAK